VHADANAKYGGAFADTGVNCKLPLGGIQEEGLVDFGVASRLHRKWIMQDIAELEDTANYTELKFVCTPTPTIDHSA
jgi:hypothetical protein